VEARRDYLATSTTGMPIAGPIAWGGLALGYWLVPEGIRVAAVAGAAALTYVYAIIAMRKPASVR
tara:strand:- start:29885 stop:30079 length:195 start_codon:yes stop_codon:yes gene_type:complete